MIKPEKRSDRIVPCCSYRDLLGTLLNTENFFASFSEIRHLAKITQPQLGTRIAKADADNMGQEGSEPPALE